MRLPLRLLLPVAFALSASLVSAQPAKKAPSAPEQTAPAPPVPAPEPDKPAPYDTPLLRLAEVIGSVSYLRALCGMPTDEWRTNMRQLLDADAAAEPARRERLTAAFNRGYRSFASVHTTCTQATRIAEQRYRHEGATLAAEITARFGN